MVKKINPSNSKRLEVQLILIRDLIDDAKSLDINVSKYKTKLNKIEKRDARNIDALISSLMSDISKEIEASKLLKDRVIKSKLESGNSYLLKDELEKGFEIFADQVLIGLEGLCITRELPKKVRTIYGLSKTKIIWLRKEKAKDEVTISSLQDLSILIQQFLNRAKKGVVLLDGFEYLVINSGFEPSIQFLQLARSRFEESDGILIIPILEGALAEREFKLLERELKPLKIEDRFPYQELKNKSITKIKRATRK